MLRGRWVEVIGLLKIQKPWFSVKSYQLLNYCHSGNAAYILSCKFSTYEPWQLRWPSGESVHLGNCRLGFDSESIQTNDLNNGIPSFPAWRSAWRTSQQVYLCRWKKHLAGFAHLAVPDRWLATPKRARTAHWSHSCDRINMQLNTETCNCFSGSHSFLWKLY